MAEGLLSATGDLAAARACWWTHKRTLIGLSIDANVSNPPGDSTPDARASEHERAPNNREQAIAHISGTDSPSHSGNRLRDARVEAV